MPMIRPSSDLRNKRVMSAEGVFEQIEKVISNEEICSKPTYLQKIFVETF